ncbi:MAG: flagellar basal body L-ring protein FlgH [Planctomycetota bacterium]|jgi:flagellar L-ring protein precursor FlgH
MSGKYFIVVVVGVTLAFITTAHAGSIWAKRHKDMGNLYADDVARNIGDVLTIVINESSKVDNKAKRDLKKETDRSIAFNGELGNYVDLGDFGMAARSANELKGKADYKDERKFTDSVTAVVMDILPNGNLVIMGTRDRNIAGDIQTIEVSGIVRPSDVAFGNIIRSDRVANFRIVTKNGGIEAPFNRPGWFGRMLDIIWPF